MHRGDAEGYFLGGYRILYKIASGSFGRVYRARQLSTGQDVAVKILRLNEGDATAEIENQRQRFRREMRLCAVLSHPHIVRLIDSGVFGAGLLYAVFEHVPGTMPFVRGSKLRALAITSAQRSPLEPGLPTMAESGVPGYEVVGWQGLFAVAGTPPDIVARLQAEVGKLLRLPEVRERLAALGAEPVGSTPQEFGAFVRAEHARWSKVIREKGIRSE